MTLQMYVFRTLPPTPKKLILQWKPEKLSRVRKTVPWKSLRNRWNIAEHRIKYFPRIKNWQNRVNTMWHSLRQKRHQNGHVSTYAIDFGIFYSTKNNKSSLCVGGQIINLIFLLATRCRWARGVKYLKYLPF